MFITGKGFSVRTEGTRLVAVTGTLSLKLLPTREDQIEVPFGGPLILQPANVNTLLGSPGSRSAFRCPDYFANTFTSSSK